MILLAVNVVLAAAVITWDLLGRRRLERRHRDADQLRRAAARHIEWGRR